MLRGLLIFAIAAALVGAMGAREVYAKTPSYVITGGELGPYAAQVFAAYSATWDGSLPGDRARLVDPPAQAPTLAYDIFTSWGTFAVPYQMANGGAEFRYVPSLGLLEHRRVDTHAEAWYELAPEQRSFLDHSIADALQLKGQGKLELGPIAADFRARKLPDVGYELCAWDGGGECASLGPGSKEFVMRDLVDTLSRAPRGPAQQPPAYVINLGDGSSIGGLLGYYSPPSGSQPGRFWDDGYLYERTTAYYETTAGFDAVIARSLQAMGGKSGPGQSVAIAGRAGRLSMAALAEIAAVLAAVAVACVALRRLRQAR